MNKQGNGERLRWVRPDGTPRRWEEVYPPEKVKEMKANLKAAVQKAKYRARHPQEFPPDPVGEFVGTLKKVERRRSRGPRDRNWQSHKEAVLRHKIIDMEERYGLREPSGKKKH